MKFFILVFTITLLFHSNAQTFGKIGDYNWPAEAKVSIPDSLIDESAFYLKNITTYDYDNGGSTQEVVYKSIYINSDEAAEKYNTKTIYTNRYGQISTLAARTVKADGTIIELDGKQIIRTLSEETNKYSDDSFLKIQIIYPDVSKGDVIELAYQIDYDFYIYSKLIQLEDDLPSLYSRVSIRNMSMMEINAYNLNNMVDIVSNKKDGIPTIYWEKNGVKSKTTGYFNALSPKSPFGVYTLYIANKKLDYKEYNFYDERVFPYNYEQFEKITAFFLNEKVFEESDPKMIQIKKIIQYLEKEYTWNYDRNTFIANHTFSFLKKKIVDDNLFQRYITKFLTENSIRFSKGFTKSLLDGQFIHGLVSFEQMENRFIVIYDENDNEHYVFPPSNENKFYYFDEIPFYLEGNSAIILDVDKGVLQQERSIFLPASSSKVNNQKSYVKMRINSNEPSDCIIERMDSFGGQYSGLIRTKKNKYWSNELAISTDSINLEPTSVDPFYPYKVKFKSPVDTLQVFTKFNDSLKWLSLEKLIPMGVFQSDELDFNNGNYLVLPFVKKTNISFFLTNNSELSLAEDVSNIEFSNSIGSIEMSCVKINENGVKINFSVIIKKRFIDGEEEVKAYEKLLYEYSIIRQKKWLFKL